MGSLECSATGDFISDTPLVMIILQTGCGAAGKGQPSCAHKPRQGVPGGGRCSGLSHAEQRAGLRLGMGPSPQASGHTGSRETSEDGACVHGAYFTCNGSGASTVVAAPPGKRDRRSRVSGEEAAHLPRPGQAWRDDGDAAPIREKTAVTRLTPHHGTHTPDGPTAPT